MNEPSPVIAIAVDGRIDPDEAAQALPWPLLRRYLYGVALALGSEETLYLFRVGAVVIDGARALSEEVRRAIESATGRRFLPISHDTYHVRADPSLAASSRVGWDVVVVPERSPELLAAVALLLGQSAALERYESAADGLLDEALSLSRELAAGGRFPAGTRELVGRVGRLTRDRLELARWFYFVDRPEETWEDARVAQLYDSLFENLELAQRHAAMLHKLSAAESATQTVISLWHGRRSNALEWAIVFLILVEIALALAGRL